MKSQFQLLLEARIARLRFLLINGVQRDVLHITENTLALNERLLALIVKK